MSIIFWRRIKKMINEIIDFLGTIEGVATELLLMLFQIVVYRKLVGID